jgi:hypothetical protein
MAYLHAVIWLDHKRAQVISFGRDSSESATVQHDGGERHLHHRRGAIGSGHAAEDPQYYEKILVAVGDAQAPPTPSSNSSSTSTSAIRCWSSA